MAKDPGLGKKIKAEVVGLKGQCNAGHKVGDRFDVSCWNTGGMCGFLYHAIFPTLQVMQFDGSYPWGTDEAVVNCPDSYNLLTIKLWRVKE
ncbi:MAG TPA: TIGR04076 family protein [Syntrophorhabdaceae bacterium]|nr:TIGR04076 family protein [Syntrophorhabdaceae bacterium]HQM82917.1 TIGR04076 family protein [Syntrophorhabdaceae bacterium]